MFQLDWQTIMVAIMVSWAAVFVWKDFLLIKLRRQVARPEQQACGGGGCRQCGNCGTTSSQKIETIAITLRHG
jgi:hypothetical protein